MPDEVVANSETNPETQQPPAASETPADFDGWYQAQPETVRALVDGHLAGLKSALTAERDARRGLEKQARELANKAEKDSQSQQELTKLADQIGEAERRADFFDAAHAAGVSNLKLAYMVATSDGLIDKRGQVDFAALRKSYPELFPAARSAPRGDAGAGTSAPPPERKTMNDLIRQAAGHH